MKSNLVKAWVNKKTHAMVKMKAAEKGIPAYEMYDLAIKKGINKDKKEMEALSDNIRFF